jgi:hypothetical protein
VNEYYHIEISCSLTSGLSEKDIKKAIQKFINKTFNEAIIIKKVNSILKKITGEKIEYKKILVLSNIPSSREEIIIEEFKSKNINIIKFEDIITEIILDLDTQYYRDDVLRTLQLTKFLLLTKPDKLAILLEKKGKHSILNQKTKQKFIDLFISQDDKILKNMKIEKISKLIKYSKLKDPEHLAKVIVEELISSKSKRKFLEAIVNQDKMKSLFKKPVKTHEIKQVLKKKQKPLLSFFNK